MKNFSILVLALLICTSCEKESESNIHGPHIFWFDKSTSDSLIANGYLKVRLSVPFIYLQPSELTHVYLSATKGYLSEPHVSDDVLINTLAMREGDTAVSAYQIAISKGGEYSYEDASRLFSNSAGTMEFIEGKVNYTKLEWK